jgi:hypothetical protein
VAAFRAWLMDQVEVWVAAMPGVKSAKSHQPLCRHATQTVSPVDLATDPIAFDPACTRQSNGSKGG